MHAHGAQECGSCCVVVVMQHMQDTAVFQQLHPGAHTLTLSLHIGTHIGIDLFAASCAHSAWCFILTPYSFTTFSTVCASDYCMSTFRDLSLQGFCFAVQEHLITAYTY